MAATYLARTLSRVALVPLLLVLHGGCSGSKRAQPQTRSSQLSQKFDSAKLSALHRELNQLDEFIDSEIDNAISEIDRSDDPDVRRAAQEWKLAVTNLTFEDLEYQHPVAKLLDTWANSARIMKFFTDGRGRNVFKNEQPIIIETLTQLQSRIDAIARGFLSDQDYRQLSTQVEAFAASHPVRHLRAIEASADFSQTEAVASTFQIPWQPLSWIGGVRDTLDPTLKLAQSVDRFTELARKYPALLRVQTKLLLMDVNRDDTVTTTVDSVERLATSSERYADIAEALPQRLREESTTLIQDSHEAIKTVDSALGKAERLGATLDGTVNEFAHAGEVWGGTADAVTRTIEQIQRWTPYVNDPSYPRPRPRQPGEKPRFDITDYTRVAEAVGQTSVQVQGLLADVRDFVDGTAPGTDLARVNALAASLLDPTAAQARDLVDRITLRAAQLAALIFVLATLYTFIARRLPGAGRSS